MSHRALTPEQFQNQCPKSIQISEFAPIIPHHSLIAFETMSSAAWFDPLVVSPPRRHPSPGQLGNPPSDWWNKGGVFTPHMTGYNGAGNNVNGGWMIHHDWSWLILFQVLFHHPFLRTISLSHYLSLPFLAMLQGCPVFQPVLWTILSKSIGMHR